MSIAEEKAEEFFGQIKDIDLKGFGFLSKPIKPKEGGLEITKEKIKVVEERIRTYLNVPLEDAVVFYVSHDGVSTNKVIKPKNKESITKKIKAKQKKIIDTLKDEFDCVSSPYSHLVNVSIDIKTERKILDDEEEIQEFIQKLEKSKKEGKEKVEEIQERAEELKEKYEQEIKNSEEYKEHKKDHKRIKENEEEIQERLEEEFEEEVKKGKELTEDLVEEIKFQPLYTSKDKSKILEPEIVEKRNGQNKVNVYNPENSHEGYGVRRGRSEVYCGIPKWNAVPIKQEFRMLNSWKTRYISNCFLILKGDNGKLMVQKAKKTVWVRRSVEEYYTPYEAENAKDEGRDVIRYGQIFFKEMKRKDNMKALEDTKYEAKKEDDTWTITHPALDDLELEGLWKAVPMNGEIYY